MQEELIWSYNHIIVIPFCAFGLFYL